MKQSLQMQHMRHVNQNYYCFSSFVFDDWHNDMPILLGLLQVNNKEENFIDWLFAFKHHTFDQKPSCFTMDNAP